MARIVVPLDESPLAEESLGWVAVIARAQGLAVHLLSVYRSDEEFWAYAELDPRASLRESYESLPAYLDALAIREPLAGLKVTAEVRTGDVGSEILVAASEGDTRIVAITTRGRGGFRPEGYGSVTDSLVRVSSVPLLVVPPRGIAPAIEGVVVTLDGSRDAELALVPARQLAAALGARVHLLRVIEPNVDWRILDEEYEPFMEHLALRADAYLRAIALPGETAAVLRDSPAETILSYADANQCQLVALASHGRDGSIRRELGGTADAVLRAADRPVLLVPAAERGPA